MCEPNDWETTVRQAAETLATGDEGTPAQILRIKYWTAFRSYLQEHGSKLRPQKPSRDHWYSFGIGTSLANTTALIITREKKIGVELYIGHENAKIIFNELLKEKHNIEATIGSPLDWRELPNRKACRIVLFNSVDPYEEATWPQQFAWLQSNLERFDQAFRPLFASHELWLLTASTPQQG